MCRFALVLPCCFLFLPLAWASNPGEPIDCGDIVVLEPGLSVSVVIPFPCPDVDGNRSFSCRAPNGGLIDNLGAFFYSRSTSLGLFDCGDGLRDDPFFRHGIYRHRDGQDELIAYVDDRCGTIPGCWDEARMGASAFDDKQGRLFIVTGARLNGPGPACNSSPEYPPIPPHGGSLCTLDGFVSIFEILEDHLPEGPPGPPGPPGSEGPPGPLIPACRDADGDAWADCLSNPSCNPYGHPCGDCDDSDSAINPGETEDKPNKHKHDGKDNDCNGLVDDFEESAEEVEP